MPTVKNRVDKMYKPVRPLTVKMYRDLSITCQDARGVDYSRDESIYFNGDDIMQVETEPGVFVDWSEDAQPIFDDYCQRLEALKNEH